jgi:hypothetical protein
MYPIPNLALFILSTLLGVAVATIVWLLRRDCDWYFAAVIGTITGAGAALCVMFIMPMTGADLPFPLKPVFVTSAVASAVFQYFHPYMKGRQP